MPRVRGCASSGETDTLTAMAVGLADNRDDVANSPYLTR